MQRVAAAVFFVALIAVVICVEYEIAMWLGFGLLLMAGGGLTVIAVALACAPLGYDSQRAFYVCRRPRRATHIPRYRFSHLIRARL